MTEQFKKKITSEHKMLDLHLRETFQYKDLIFLFVKRDFTSRYKQTILGPLWAVIQPLLSTIVFVIVFGKLANLTTADVAGDFCLPQFLFYMSGNICWIYFSTTFETTTRVFIDNSSVMGKVYFPRLVSPISVTISKLIPFAIQLGMFVALWLFYLVKGGTSILITPWLLLVPLLILQMMLLSMGLGLIISAFTTRYRDLLMLVTFGLEILRYFCPIAYGLQLVPKSFRGIYVLNPLTPVLTTFRLAFFGFGYFNLFEYLISWAFTGVILFVGLLCFNKTERNFMDII